MSVAHHGASGVLCRDQHTPASKPETDAQKMGNQVDTLETYHLKPIIYNDISCLGGAPTRTRTADLLITNQLLYQLSYRGTGVAFSHFVEAMQEESRTHELRIFMANLISDKLL